MPTSNRAPRSFATDTSGAIALLTALVLFVLTGVTALALEFGNAMRARYQMQNALDATLLAVAREASVNGVGDEAELRRFGTDYLSRFEVSSGTTVERVTIEPDDGTVRGRIELSVSAPFATLLTGHNRMRVEVAAAVAVSEPRHIELHLILDVSDSMNIAATPAEIARLTAISQPYSVLKAHEDSTLADGCAFACHFRHHTDFEPPGKTMYDLARDNNVLLRTDVVANASKALARTALTGHSPHGGNVRIGVFHFSSNWEQSLAPSASRTQVESAIDTPTIDRLETYLEQHLSSIAARVGTSGTGRSAADPVKLAVIATDGMMGGRAPKHGIDPATCDALKSSGVTVAAIFVEPISDNSSPWRDMVEPYKADAEAKLRACTSGPGYFFRAESPADIEAAFGSALDALTGPKVRLTN